MRKIDCFELKLIKKDPLLKNLKVEETTQFGDVTKLGRWLG